MLITKEIYWTLICFRKLKCPRVTIHKHLFLSYILTAVLWISYYATSSFDPKVVEENPVSMYCVKVYNVRIIVFNVSFNNISVISWRSVLLVGEIGVLGDTLSHNVVSSTPRMSGIKMHCSYTCRILTLFLSVNIWPEY